MTNNNRFESCVLYREFTEEELQTLRPLVVEESFDRGQDILTEGKIFPALWMVMKGRCEVLKSCGNGSEHTLAVIEEAGVFGEMSFFEPVPHSATVRATTPIETIRLSRDAFDQLLAQSPQAAYKIVSFLVKLLSGRLRTMDNLACALNDRAENGSRFAEWREFQTKLYGDWSF